MRALVALVAITSLAYADRRVMVLPIDGDATPAQRKQIDAVLLDLAKKDGATASIGGATFAETSAAVGCPDRDQTCEDLVMSTLNVDGLVYGTSANGKVTISLAEAKHPHRELVIELGEGKQVTATDVQPLFDETPPGPPPPAPAPSVAREVPPPVENHDRAIGIGCIAGGALVTIIGLALWASESSLQSQIDNHKTNSSDDIKDLVSIEDRASTYAWEGNIAFVIGLAAIGTGTYFLVRDHQVHATVAPTTGGAAVMFGGAW
ncbi:MAG: hypothetical protein QM831_35145 [Kofleriaceae bacterium]